MNLRACRFSDDSGRPSLLTPLPILTFDLSLDTRFDESAHEYVPKSADDLLQADALIRAHRMRLQSSISLTCKELRLAPEVLFSTSLWQLLTILRIYFTGLRIQPV